MILSEEEAKKKFCPHMREGNMVDLQVDGVAVNSIWANGERVFANCIASGCMMWRTEGVEEKDSGFCGLAY